MGSDITFVRMGPVELGEYEIRIAADYSNGSLSTEVPVEVTVAQGRSQIQTPSITVVPVFQGFVVSWDRVPSAGSYTVRYGTDLSADDAGRLTTGLTTTITGLRAGASYWVRVRANVDIRLIVAFSTSAFSSTERVVTLSADDSRAPVLSSLATNEAGDRVVLTYDEVLDSDHVPPLTAFHIREYGFGVGENGFPHFTSHNGTLYMVGASNDALYTFSLVTGIATRVGSATRFGVNETNPGYLASHNGTLYMVSLGAFARLYTLNTSTGVATRVGSATRFGVGESFPSGLASHNGTLYMVGNTNDTLFTLNTTTGRATRVGSATQFGVNEQQPEGLASLGGVLYLSGSFRTLSGGERQSGSLYSLDPSSGIASAIAVVMTEFHPQPFSGDMFSSGNSLYLRRAGHVYSINTSTGIAEEVTSAVSDIEISGLTVTLSVLSSLLSEETYHLDYFFSSREVPVFRRLQDRAGNQVRTYTARDITNNVTGTAPPTPDPDPDPTLPIPSAVVSILGANTAQANDLVTLSADTTGSVFDSLSYAWSSNGRVGGCLLYTSPSPRDS